MEMGDHTLEIHKTTHRSRLDSGISEASLKFHIPTWIIKKFY